MRYLNAQEVFPAEIIELLQNYADGEYIYIPRKNEKRKKWGESTGAKEETARRNSSIYMQYKQGKPVGTLAESFYLSEKSIWRIVAQEKRTEEAIKNGAMGVNL